MIQNAGFEDGGGGGGKPEVALGFEPWPPPDYREGTVSINERLAHTGRRSQELQMRPENNLIRQITFYNTARPGQHYVAGAWVRADSADETASAWISLDATRNDMSVIKSSHSKDRVQGKSKGWTWLQCTLTAPPDAQRLSLNLHAKGQKGSAWFDDLYLGTTDPKRE
jgi:hypothetical protein